MLHGGKRKHRSTLGTRRGGRGGARTRREKSDRWIRNFPHRHGRQWSRQLCQVRDCLCRTLKHIHRSQWCLQVWDGIELFHRPLLYTGDPRSSLCTERAPARCSCHQHSRFCLCKTVCTSFHSALYNGIPLLLHPAACSLPSTCPRFGLGW